VNRTDLNTDDVKALSAVFLDLGESSAALAQDFRSAGGAAATMATFGDEQLVGSYKITYAQALAAINQITTSLSAISKKLAIVAENVERASDASTLRQSP